MSTQAARSILDLQDQLAPVADSVQQTLGPVYAGIWFDNSAGGIMKVEVTNLKSPQVLASEQAVAEQGFASDVDFQAVASSWSQLAAGQASLDQQFQDLEAAKKLSTQLDASTNSVDVEASTSLSPQQLAAVRAAADASPVSAIVTQVPASTLQFTDAANSCAQTPGLAGTPSATGKGPFLFCDSPLRGGPAIVAPALHDPNSAQLCTMGFFAHKGSTRFILTSGHCLKAAGPTWSTEFPDQDFMGHAAYTPIKLGNNYSSTFGAGGCSKASPTTLHHTRRRAWITRPSHQPPAAAARAPPGRPHTLTQHGLPVVTASSSRSKYRKSQTHGQSGTAFRDQPPRRSAPYRAGQRLNDPEGVPVPRMWNRAYATAT